MSPGPSNVGNTIRVWPSFNSRPLFLMKKLPTTTGSAIYLRSFRNEQWPCATLRKFRDVDVRHVGRLGHDRRRTVFERGEGLAAVAAERTAHRTQFALQAESGSFEGLLAATASLPKLGGKFSIFETE